MNRNASQTEMIIEMKDLAVGYGLRKVLSGIRAGIYKGQFVSFLGPNGAGKTTLLRTLSRHLRKIEGTLIVNGRVIESYRQKELAAGLAVVLTSRLDTELFTGFEFAAMGRHPHTGLMGALTCRDKEKVWESLELVNAVNLAERQMNELSDGEKQKLFIARALAQEPKIVILDEPTAHLDLKHQMEIMAILRDSCKEKEITIIASMHDVGIAARVSDMVALIKDGAVIAWGRPEEVLHGANVSELYGIDSAVYDRTIGTLEMKVVIGTKKVFCVSGSGTGAVLFRSLARNKIDVSTGVLHENDVDCHVANAIGITVFAASAFKKITKNALNKCTEPIAETDCVIDTGFPVGETNRLNLRLLEYALGIGKRVISLRKPEDLAALDLRNSDRIVTAHSEYSIVEIIVNNNFR